jgi:hypothetical protein
LALKEFGAVLTIQILLRLRHTPGVAAWLQSSNAKAIHMLNSQCASPHQSSNQDHTKLTTLSRQTTLYEQSVKPESELPSNPEVKLGGGFFPSGTSLVAYENTDR